MFSLVCPKPDNKMLKKPWGAVPHQTPLSSWKLVTSLSLQQGRCHSTREDRGVFRVKPSSEVPPPFELRLSQISYRAPFSKIWQQRHNSKPIFTTLVLTYSSSQSGIRGGSEYHWILGKKFEKQESSIQMNQDTDVLKNRTTSLLYNCVSL